MTTYYPPYRSDWELASYKDLCDLRKRRVIKFMSEEEAMAKAPIISNHTAREYVQGRRPFRNHNHTMFARWEREGQYYVVYSYRPTWPMWVWDDANRVWFSNADKYSVTTTKHMGQTHPYAENVRKLPREMLLELLGRSDS